MPQSPLSQVCTRESSALGGGVNMRIATLQEERAGKEIRKRCGQRVKPKRNRLGSVVMNSSESSEGNALNET